jgi:RNA polymerase sigma-70 factor (ECF subfamily)
LDSDEVFPKLQDRAAGVEENLLAKERHHRLGRALSRLSPQERQCLDLRSEGLSYREIGGILGIRIATVATFLARGIQKILRELNG